MHLKNLTLPRWFLISCFVFASYGSPGARAATHADWDLLPAGPESDYIEVLDDGTDLGFCAEWNPEFAYRGHHCCYKKPVRRKRRGLPCAPRRSGTTYCEEMTPEQRRYAEDVKSGKIPNLLKVIDLDIEKRPVQSYCGVNGGFLVHGRQLVPTALNRIKIRSPDRCVDFGTDRMIGMLEWLGRRVAEQYPAPDYAGVSLVLGDISAPRGGCLAGRSGQKGHASHTSGQDADIGFLVAKKNRPSPVELLRELDAKTNWWLLKELFRNPYACVKVIFLDRKLINKLARTAGSDPLWLQYRRFIRHVKFHKNHFHVRIGDHAGPPGCEPGANPDLELEGEDGEGAREDWELRELIRNSESAVPAAMPSPLPSHGSPAWR